MLNNSIDKSLIIEDIIDDISAEAIREIEDDWISPIEKTSEQTLRTQADILDEYMVNLLESSESYE